ncbi:hypothetical protein AQ505_12795 [Pedobacter sp. PACM 27299]|uniref:hypothetical protein n=1 Tax=Pedobacter sp. PACM 27299 TaxID=1727164 RepID=UPI000705D88C|nr:hypothetical protein [Pedobacter sp. PACM 27299]ALL06297.1 hypothetical protein AQ505_12795 [Pedobacter sp. PACM 27299]
MEDYNKILNYQPHNIPEQFVIDPDSGINIFFSFHPIPETREKIKLLFRAWLRLLNVYAEPSDISAMLLFQEQLIEFVEVSYIKGVKEGYLPKPVNQPID